jgi:putative ABC transport system permease protein
MTYAGAIQLPRVSAVAVAALVVMVAAVCASLLPAARAARVDVLQALRTE